MGRGWGSNEVKDKVKSQKKNVPFSIVCVNGQRIVSQMQI